MTTSPGPVAQRPSCRRKAVSFSAPARRESKPVPKYGPVADGLAVAADDQGLVGDVADRGADLRHRADLVEH